MYVTVFNAGIMRNTQNFKEQNDKFVGFDCFSYTFYVIPIEQPVLVSIL
jgi:hypothetical protein